jgi:pentatricopeptide repeat protein
VRLLLLPLLTLGTLLQRQHGRKLRWRHAWRRGVEDFISLLSCWLRPPLLVFTLLLQNAAYCSAISACGRAGHVGRAMELRDEMLHSGLEMTLNIRLAMLHAFAGESARCSCQGLRQRGLPVDCTE